jgi:hypothetical protein
LLAAERLASALGLPTLEKPVQLEDSEADSTLGRIYPSIPQNSPEHVFCLVFDGFISNLLKNKYSYFTILVNSVNLDGKDILVG